MKNANAIKVALDKIFEGANELQPLLEENLKRLTPLLKKSLSEMGISEKVRIAQFLLSMHSVGPCSFTVVKTVANFDQPE